MSKCLSNWHLGASVGHSREGFFGQFLCWGCCELNKPKKSRQAGLTPSQPESPTFFFMSTPGKKNLPKIGVHGHHFVRLLKSSSNSPLHSLFPSHPRDLVKSSHSRNLPALRDGSVGKPELFRARKGEKNGMGRKKRSHPRSAPVFCFCCFFGCVLFAPVFFSFDWDGQLTGLKNRFVEGPAAFSWERKTRVQSKHLDH